MRAGRSIVMVIGLGLAGGCGQVEVPQDQPAPSAPQPSPAISTTIAAPPTTAAPTTPAPTATTRPPITTTTTRPLTRAEATERLCRAVADADAAIQEGKLVAGGLKLSSGIANYEKAAAPPVVSAARTMLRSGLDGDVDGYADARQAASTACRQAGFPIQLGGPIMCVTTPCP